MTIKEKLTAKIKELNEAVSEANGSVMVIGHIENVENNEIDVITSLHGKTAALTVDVATLLSNDSRTPMRNIVEDGFALANLLKIKGGGIADVIKVETHKSNNL
jgi:ACT domain-containing protein